MATKYILDPSGNIIKVENGESVSVKIQDLQSNNNEYLSEQFDLNEVSTDTDLSEGFLGIGFVSGQDADSGDLGFVTGKSETAPSFGFESETDGNYKSYKTFNSFLRKEDDDNPKPKAFADEFEILTGLRMRYDEFLDSASTVALMITYLAESIVRILTVEAIVAANRSLINKKGDESKTAERYKLRLGTYDFTELEIFTKYVFNVLNYPHEQSTSLERLDAYFIGTAAWLSPDAAVNLDSFSREKGSALNSIDFATNNKSLSKSLEGFLPVTLASAEILAATITNTTSLNRVKLLLRKFYQEKHWDQNILYSAKDKNPVLGYFADLNYYYFKFVIERIQVGLKLLNKYYYDDSYLQSRQKESPINRVSAARAFESISQTITIPSGSNAKGTYNWSYNERGNNNTPIKARQTTSLRTLPQAFNMNYSFYRSLALNGKPTLDLSDDLAQNFYRSEERRLPIELVKEIENNLESEYMPFYFHDLRTNEILSFHAFIENISDSFSPEYNSASGFGRIDDVKSYVKTTRNINLTFIIAATSEADHDLMWFQVNKIVAMVYPQWSDAFEVASKDNKTSEFKYPFTQVPTASPLIRLRVGDVIKSNYSRTNLSRLHGIGDRDQDKGITDNKKKEEAQESIKELNTLIKRYNKAEKIFMKNKILGRFNKKNSKKLLNIEDASARIDQLQNVITKYYLQPGLYRTASSGLLDDLGLGGLTKPKMKSIKIDHEVLIKNDFTKNLDFPVIEINEGSYKGSSVVADISKIRVLNPDPLVKDKKDSSAFLKDTNKIMQPETDGKSNNPITRAYESGMSRGLAGFITNLDVGYNESTWETSRIGSKAPMMVKINIGFSPIHDIPPGLDHNGMLRAPVYNVGRINNQFFGDVHDGDAGHSKGFEAARKKHTEIKNSTK
jgi:hypothetical protein